MKKTVITNFYNEEYLLPWWLMHHRQIFDHGILIDYDSTDRSVEIIKQYCPTWEIVTSRNREFDARKNDEEIMDYETKTSGWKICLNTTEFIVGDFSILDDTPNQEYKIPCYIMIDKEPENNNLSYDISLLKQKPFGVSYDESNPITIERCCRAIHNKFVYNYPTGRHFIGATNRKLQVLWYGYSPLTDKLMQRKLQIQNRIPESDKNQGFGHHHFTDETGLMAKYNRYLPLTVDLSVELNLNY